MQDQPSHELSEAFTKFVGAIECIVERLIVARIPPNSPKLSTKEVTSKYKVSSRTLSRHISDGRLSNYGSRTRPIFDEGEVIEKFSRR